MSLCRRLLILNRMLPDSGGIPGGLFSYTWEDRVFYQKENRMDKFVRVTFPVAFAIPPTVRDITVMVGPEFNVHEAWYLASMSDITTSGMTVSWTEEIGNDDRVYLNISVSGYVDGHVCTITENILSKDGKSSRVIKPDEILSDWLVDLPFQLHNFKLNHFMMDGVVVDPYKPLTEHMTISGSWSLTQTVASYTFTSKALTYPSGQDMVYYYRGANLGSWPAVFGTLPDYDLFGWGKLKQTTASIREDRFSSVQYLNRLEIGGTIHGAFPVRTYFKLSILGETITTSSYTMNLTTGSWDDTPGGQQVRRIWNQMTDGRRVNITIYMSLTPFS